MLYTLRCSGIECYFKEIKKSILRTHKVVCFVRGCQMVCMISNQKSQFGYILKLTMLVYVLVIWNILRPFGIFNGPLVCFTKKNLATLLLMQVFTRDHRICSWFIEWTPRSKRANGVSRVARWFVFKPKIPIWVNFGGRWYGRCWCIIWPFGLFYGHLTYFTAFGYILRYFGIFYPFW
jgi:hypothetical protein